MVKKVEPTLLHEKTAEIIRQKIVGGELAAGSRLSETALSKQLAISRNTLREVFRLLTQQGLLRYEPNRGVCVARPDMAAIVDIYRLRRLVECSALRNAWPLHPAMEKMAAAVSLGRERSAAQDWTGVGTANMQFHSAIVDLADSERLNRLYRNISAELRLAFSQLNDARLLHAPYVEKNGAILALLTAGQNEQAVQALSVYLEVSERTVLAALSRRGW
ncbi:MULTISPECIES: GntR family transcriptional regulator [Tenebrionibacter/Tenebrionicola group]|uniref:GntR family transcriptional regulator n=1 Tax=Tenebrionibacter/Tenebrionicola group TaxID=2969848 RepID=UPI0037D9AE79